MERWSIAWRILAVCTALAVFWLFPADAEDAVYVENQWNYVDVSMDVSQGIPADATGRLGRIRDAGKLTVATEPYFPPQEYIDDRKTGQDRFVGADMSLARLIAQRMGVALEIVPLAFSDVLDSVAEGRYDLAISALAFTDGRAATLEMSKGYYYSGEEISSGLLLRGEDAQAVRSVGDVAAMDIAAQSGSLQETMAAEHLTQYRQFLRLSSVAEVIQAVRDGTVAAGVVDADTASLYISAHPEAGLTYLPVSEFSLEPAYKGDRVAAKKGETQLIAFVNGVIDEVLATDRYSGWLREFTAGQ